MLKVRLNRHFQANSTTGLICKIEPGSTLYFEPTKVSLSVCPTQVLVFPKRVKTVLYVYANSYNVTMLQYQNVTMLKCYNVL